MTVTHSVINLKMFLVSRQCGYVVATGADMIAAAAAQKNMEKQRLSGRMALPKKTGMKFFVANHRQLQSSVKETSNSVLFTKH
jgi:hypothetical protein